MSDVTGQILRRIIQVSRGPETPEALLASIGLPSTASDPASAREFVAADAYYDVLERCTADGDAGLPFRYGESLRPEDLGALGLAVKTAATVGEGLERLIRYVLVISDTLEYDLADGDGDGRMFVLRGRPFELRRGVGLANECALAAVISVLRQIAVAPVAPATVSFRHRRPVDAAPHRAFFGCLVRFEADVDALHFSDRVLATPTRLGDEGLSTFLLAQLDDLRARRSERSLVARVRSAVADALCDGPPRKAQVARRLGMSERTLHRRLAEQGQTFQDVATTVRRQVAESLLSTTAHSLSEVAFLTGFSDQSAFQRAFKGWTGHTPLGFRQATG